MCMTWYVNISLKSSRYVTIDNLQSVNEQSGYDGSIEKYSNFEEFHLVNGQNLTFIGSSVVTLSSNDIEYIEFNKKN